MPGDEPRGGSEGPLPDIVGPGVRLLLVGINPGRRSAALGQHFAGRSNRFWPALRDAGITPRRLDPSEQWRLPDHGVGLTNLVARASGSAAELTVEELRAGGAALTGKVADWRPAVVAVLGVSAFRVAFDRRDARVGSAETDSTGIGWWVLPNPSGLNAHATPAEHAAGLRAAAEAAGLVSGPGPSRL